MAKYCTICGSKTNCTDSCKECAKETYAELKSLAGKAELVSEEAIKNDLGKGALELLKEHGYIEYCATLNNQRMYAI